MAEPTTTVTTPDALLVLRLALSSSLEINLVSISSTPAASSSSPVRVETLSAATHLSFPSLSKTSPPVLLPKGSPTRFYQRPNPDHSDPNSPVYDLQTLYLGWVHRDATTGDYIRLSRNEGAGFVSVTDRKLVVDFLGGGHPEQIANEKRIRDMNEREEGDTRKVLGDSALGQSETSLARTMDTTNMQSSTQMGTTNENKRDGTGADAQTDRAQAGGPPLKKARYTADKSDQEKVKRMLHIISGPQFGHIVGPNETTASTPGNKADRIGGGAAHHTRETVLRGERYNNFDSVRSLVGPRLKALQETLKNSSSSSAAALNQPGSLRPVQSSKKKQLNPIIMISPSQTALITMHNVKDFLQDARFVPSAEAKAMNSSNSGAGSSGYVAEDVVQINHARASTQGGVETRMARYFVVDSVEALAKFGGQGREEEAWDRVVCVMTTGQEWQFKNYKWKEPKELFHHVKGIYPQLTRDPSNPKVKAWNVAELRIDPHKRHIDKSVVAEFWRNLESWISEKKPWLSY